MIHANHLTPVPSRSRAFYVLSGILALLVVCWLALVVMLYLSRADNASHAFDTGRLVRFIVETGEMQGNAGKAKEPALSREDYKRQRVEEARGAARGEESQPTPPALTSTTEAPSPEAVAENAESSIPEQPITETAATPAIPPRMGKAMSSASAPALKASQRKVEWPLAAAPQPDMVETLPDGKTLPIVSAKGNLVPWQYYGKPYKPVPGDRQISIVITNLGMNSAATQLALWLDERITLAFSPYAPNLREQVATARTSGFETWLNLPMQHAQYPIHDYGPLTLLEEENPESNKALLHEVLASADGIVGLVATPDERFSRSAQMVSVFEELSKRGILLTLYDQQFSPAANGYMLNRAQTHIHSGNLPATTAQLFADTESYLNTGKHVVITMAAMPAVMQQLGEWIATFPERHIELVPLSVQSTVAMPKAAPAAKPEE
jgi:polysaccharide deacetylase 2 family uncharacterized protein YibQ